MMQILSATPMIQTAPGSAPAGEGGDMPISGVDFFSAILAQQIKNQLELSLPTAASGRDGDVTGDEAALRDFLEGLEVKEDGLITGASQDASPLAALVAQIATAARPQGAEGGKAATRDGGDVAGSRSVDAVTPDPVLVRTEADKEGAGAEEFAADGKDVPLELSAAVRRDDEKSGDVGGFADKLVMARHDIARVESSAGVHSAQPARASVEPRVGSPEWGDAFGQKVVWLAGQQKQSAELQLNPPHLGPLEVKISLGQDQLTAAFVSNHAAVREAIESALPRLRDMLAESGIMLGNVTVGAESFAQQQQQQQHSSHASSRREEDEGGFSMGEGRTDERPVAVSRIGEDGWVDTFV